MNKSEFSKFFKIDNERVKKALLYFASFFVPFFVLFGIFKFLDVHPFGNNSYLPIDVDSQYLSFFTYFRNIFLEGSSVFYSLGKSIGGDMYGLFAYYLASPFNLIFLMFDKENITVAFYVVLMIKTAFSGLTMCYYLNRRKPISFFSLIFAFGYALSSYAITYGFNVMWMDAMILLPLVIRRFRGLDREERNCSLCCFSCCDFDY